MSESGQEIEAKFYLLHPDKMITRLQTLQARLIQSRVLEINLRFDLPNHSLRSQGKVLRLRRDTEAKLTYKGAGKNNSGVLGREEIEFVVNDFEKARQFLKALGYQQTMVYEKYRETYELDDALIMLDELPYGNFIEIEGENVEQVQAIASRLELDAKAAIPTSYTALFENIRRSLQLRFEDISFANFRGIKVSSANMGVRAADNQP